MPRKFPRKYALFPPADHASETSVLHAGLRVLCKAHSFTPEELTALLPPEAATYAAPLTEVLNERLATLLTVSTWDLDAIPVELHLPPLLPPSKAAIPDIAQEYGQRNQALLTGIHMRRQQFLKDLRQQLKDDNAILTQKFRGEIRALVKATKELFHAQHIAFLRERTNLRVKERQEKLDRELARLRGQLEHINLLRKTARQRSAVRAAKAKLKLERRLAWQEEYLPRKKLETQIRRNAARQQADEIAANIAEAYITEVAAIEREKQEGIVRIAREAKESYLAELEAEAYLANERKLEAARIEKFTLTVLQQRRLTRAELRLARNREKLLDEQKRLQKAEERQQSAELHLEQQKEAFLNKRAHIHNLRELNIVKAEGLGLDSKQPLSAWKAAEKRARELGLPTTAANDETEIPAVTPATKEQTR